VRAIAGCVARIESARAAALAANDGVVGWRMTALEREWRLLSRSDPDAGLMDLWARIAPAAWIDRKRWRDSERDAKVDAAVALAADVDGVEAAESAIALLGAALAPWGTPIGTRVRWRCFEQDSEHVAALLAEPLRAACDALAARGVEPVVLERAQRLEREVHEAASSRFPERPMLARDLSHAAFVDCVWRAAALPRPDPVTPLRALWGTGYVLSGVDASGVTIEIPPLSA
jgi:hypothetical protein